MEPSDLPASNSVGASRSAEFLLERPHVRGTGLLDRVLQRLDPRLLLFGRDPQPFLDERSRVDYLRHAHRIARRANAESSRRSNHWPGDNLGVVWRVMRSTRGPAWRTATGSMSSMPTTMGGSWARWRSSRGASPRPTTRWTRPSLGHGTDFGGERTWRSWGRGYASWR